MSINTLYKKIKKHFSWGFFFFVLESCVSDVRVKLCTAIISIDPCLQRDWGSVNFSSETILSFNLHWHSRCKHFQISIHEGIPCYTPRWMQRMNNSEVDKPMNTEEYEYSCSSVFTIVLRKAYAFPMYSSQNTAYTFLKTIVFGNQTLLFFHYRTESCF